MHDLSHSGISSTSLHDGCFLSSSVSSRDLVGYLLPLFLYQWIPQIWAVRPHPKSKYLRNMGEMYGKSPRPTATQVKRGFRTFPPKASFLVIIPRLFLSLIHHPQSLTPPQPHPQPELQFTEFTAVYLSPKAAGDRSNRTHTQSSIKVPPLLPAAWTGSFPMTLSGKLPTFSDPPSALHTSQPQCWQNRTLR